MVMLFDIRRGVVQLCIRCGTSHPTFFEDQYNFVFMVEHHIRHSSRSSTTLYSLWNISSDIRRGLVQLCIRCGTSYSTFVEDQYSFVFVVENLIIRHSSRISTTLYLLWNISFDFLVEDQYNFVFVVEHLIRHSSRISTALYSMWKISFDILVEDQYYCFIFDVDHLI